MFTKWSNFREAQGDAGFSPRPRHWPISRPSPRGPFRGMRQTRYL